MIIKKTTDTEEIKKALCHPDIYPRISQDGSPSRESYKVHMPDSALFLAGYEDSLVGVMIFDALSPYLYDCHIHVLPDQRGHALNFAQSSFEYLWNNTRACKVTAQIALIYPDVIKFAQKCGFRCEGINAKSYVKHGQLHDQAYMGLER